ncbi:hypothetical protein ZIOFF_062977 [Zingiber officinale]|uniref:Uncharacterized protein n=1 Tax=Zingiber officinale TaxID=94328 RepID=A0A8J5F1V9_ZINOF|nr:hypothetical protein ZIOFF_062977 [Zingiber officinale]
MPRPGRSHPDNLLRNVMLFRLLPRRRKMAVVRLGRRRGWQWRGRRLLTGLLRRTRLRWLAAKYREALKRLSELPALLVRELPAGGIAPVEAAQSSRLLMESYFAVPFLPAVAIHY